MKSAQNTPPAQSSPTAPRAIARVGCRFLIGQQWIPADTLGKTSSSIYGQTFMTTENVVLPGWHGRKNALSIEDDSTRA